MNPNPRFQPGPLDPDNLERRLARNPFRAPPADWRDTILAQAAAAADEATATARDGSAAARTVGPATPRVNGSPVPDAFHGPAGPLVRFLDWLASGWTVAAGAWLLVFGLNQYSIPAGDAGGPPRPPLSAAALDEIRAQRLDLLQEAHAVSPEPSPTRQAEPQPPIRPTTRPRAEIVSSRCFLALVECGHGAESPTTPDETGLT